MKHRPSATFALLAILLGSLSLPCFAAGLGEARPMTAPCETPDAGARALCTVPGTGAPLTIAPEGVPTPDVTAAAPLSGALHPRADAPVPASPVVGHSPPPPEAPAYLLHSAFLI